MNTNYLTTTALYGLAFVLTAQGALARAEEAGSTERGRPIQLPPISVTATKTEKALEDVPAAVSIITSQQIEENLSRDIKDLVQFEPGVSVRANPARFTAALAPTGRDGNSGFNIRGLEGNRVLMLIDGVRIPDGFTFGAQSAGRGDYTDLSVLKSVEILRGPASALYGSDGVAGIVAYTTKDAEDLLTGDKNYFVQAKAGYTGADRSWQKSVLGATQWGDWSFLGAYDRRDGHAQKTQGTNASSNVDRTKSNPLGLGSNALLGKVGYEPDENNSFRLTFDHFDSDLHVDVLSAIAKPPLGSTSTLSLTADDDLKRNRVMLDHHFTGSWGFITDASWAVYYQESATQQFSAEDRNTAADRTRRNTFNNRVWGLSTQLGSALETGAITHRFTYGGDASFTRQSGLRDGTVPPVGESYPTRAFPTTTYTLAGLYAQDEIGLLDGTLILYPALRLDYYDLTPKQDALLSGFNSSKQDDTHVSPKVGGVYKLTEDVRLFANYARGFKAPSPSQVNNFFSNPVQFYTSLPNPNLKPETSEAIDGGVRFNNTFVAAEVAGFTGWYRNFIDQAQVGGAFTATNPGVFQYVNVGRAKISGVEGKAKVNLGGGFDVQSAIAYARGTTRTATTSTPLQSIDPLKIVTGIGYRAPIGVGGKFTMTHVAGKNASRIAPTCTPSCFASPNFTAFDLTTYWEIREYATLRVGIFNLTDKKYWWWSDVRGVSATSTTLDAYTAPGRNVSVSLVVHN